jgi:hypothetical protein
VEITGFEARPMDGRTVSAHVPADVEHQDPATESYEEWVVLDIADGRVLGRVPTSTSSAGSHHIPHPDGEHMNDAWTRLLHWERAASST